MLNPGTLSALGLLQTATEMTHTCRAGLVETVVEKLLYHDTVY